VIPCLDVKFELFLSFFGEVLRFRWRSAGEPAPDSCLALLDLWNLFAPFLVRFFPLLRLFRPESKLPVKAGASRLQSKQSSLLQLQLGSTDAFCDFALLVSCLFLNLIVMANFAQFDLFRRSAYSGSSLRYCSCDSVPVFSRCPVSVECVQRLSPCLFR